MYNGHNYYNNNNGNNNSELFNFNYNNNYKDNQISSFKLDFHNILQVNSKKTNEKNYKVENKIWKAHSYAINNLKHYFHFN